MSRDHRSDNASPRQPLPVTVLSGFLGGRDLTFPDDQGHSLSDVARLDTMVTVVDAKRFLADWKSEDDLAARKAALGEDDERTVA